MASRKRERERRVMAVILMKVGVFRMSVAVAARAFMMDDLDFLGKVTERKLKSKAELSDAGGRWRSKWNFYKITK